MSTSSKKISLLLIFCALSSTIISVKCALLARPDFMPPRITNQSGPSKQLIQEIQDLDLNPQDLRWKPALGIQAKNEIKPESPYKLHCTTKTDGINLTCCSFFRGSRECKPVNMSQTIPFTTEIPIKKIDMANYEIQQLVANFERKLFNKITAKIQREVAAIRQVKL